MLRLVRVGDWRLVCVERLRLLRVGRLILVRLGDWRLVCVDSLTSNRGAWGQTTHHGVHLYIIVVVQLSAEHESLYWYSAVQCHVVQ